MFLIVLAVAGFALGALVRRWPVLLAALFVPAYFAGLHADVWGSGVGEFWELAALGSTLVTLAAVVAGIVAARILTSASQASRARSMEERGEH